MSQSHKPPTRDLIQSRLARLAAVQALYVQAFQNTHSSDASESVKDIDPDEIFQLEKTLRHEWTDVEQDLTSELGNMRSNKRLYLALLNMYKERQESIEKLICDGFQKEGPERLTLKEGEKETPPQEATIPKGEALEPLLKAILKAGVAELLLGRTPKAVVISEYVELTKAFYDKREPALVHYFLDHLTLNEETLA